MTEVLHPDDVEWIDDVLSLLRDASMRPDAVVFTDGRVRLEFELAGFDE